MKKLTHDAIIYSLNASDVQTVALQEIERELSENEIIKIEEVIASNIDWYDAIANAIHSELE
jgi:RNA-binding protein YhbY